MKSEAERIPSVAEIVEMLKVKRPLPSVSEALLRLEARRIQSKWQHAAKQPLTAQFPETKRRVINGTGILLHTNLGRAPLGKALIENAAEILGGSLDLEMDLNSGKRGRRTEYLEKVTEVLNSHYQAVWVNNCAAALLLVLNTLLKETSCQNLILPRGELVEIGGGFRVPDIMQESGLRLVEIGTTNKTRLEDYQSAVKKFKPAIICRIHPSNFKMTGFTHAVEPASLISLCQKTRSPLVYDVGTLSSDEIRGLPKGFDFITLSSDKTLGGPQGGLILCAPKWKKFLLSNQLYRALRLDKISICLLERVMQAHADKKDRDSVPFSKMFFSSPQAIYRRVCTAKEALEPDLAGKPLKLNIVACQSEVGGGSSADTRLASFGLAVTQEHNPKSAARIASVLRTTRPAILGSIQGGSFVIDFRTILPDEELALSLALRHLAKIISMP